MVRPTPSRAAVHRFLRSSQRLWPLAKIIYKCRPPSPRRIRKKGRTPLAAARNNQKVNGSGLFSFARRFLPLSPVSPIASPRNRALCFHLLVFVSAKSHLVLDPSFSSPGPALSPPPPLPNRKCHSRASVLRGPVLLVFLFVGFHPLASCVMKSGYLLTRSSIQSLIQNLLAPSVRCLARPRRRTMFSHFPLLFLLPVLMSFWVGRFSLLSSFRAKPLLSGA